MPDQFAPSSATNPNVLITLATFNEAGNLQPLIETIRQFAPTSSILVIDDNSPDGTGEIADRLSGQLSNIHVIHRPGKLGLGTATLTAMQFAMNITSTTCSISTLTSVMTHNTSPRLGGNDLLRRDDWLALCARWRG